MSYAATATLAELSAQIDTARAALAAAERLARQLQQRVEAEARAKAEACGNSPGQLEQTAPPIEVSRRARGQARPGSAGRIDVTATNGLRRSKQPEVAVHRLFA